MSNKYRTKEIKESLEMALHTDEVHWYEYSPGNGTRFELVLTKHPRSAEWLITWVGVGSMIIPLSMRRLSTGYVAEKLRTNDSDAACITELVGLTLDLTTVF